MKEQTNQIKSLLFSHHHGTSALVSEILMSVLQTVQKKTTKKTSNLHMDRQCKKKKIQFTYGQTVQKKQQAIYIWTDSAKKLHWSIYSAPDSAKNGQYIFTDCTEDNVQNTHTYTQYT